MLDSLVRVTRRVGETHFVRTSYAHIMSTILLDMYQQTSTAFATQECNTQTETKPNTRMHNISMSQDHNPRSKARQKKGAITQPEKLRRDSRLIPSPKPHALYEIVSDQNVQSK